MLVMIVDDSSASNPSYPSGNTTVTMTVELGNNNNANVTVMSVNFVPASGGPINLGNSFVENYGTHVWSAVLDLGGFVGHDAQASYLSQCGTNASYCTLGMAYEDASWAVADLVFLLQTSSLTSGFYNYNVPNIASLVLTWRWPLGCVQSLGAAGLVAVGIILFPEGTLGWFLYATASAGYSAWTIGTKCLSQTQPP